MTDQEPTDKQTTPPASSVAVVSVAAQAGCLTLIIIVAALLAGIWLDSQFQLRGPFTIGLVLLSIPLSLLIMVRTTLGALKRLKLPPPTIFRQKGGE